MREGWTYKKLGEVAQSDLGKTLNSSKDKGTLYPYLCAVNVLWDNIDTTTLKETRFEESELERYSVKKGDLLICEGGDIGRAAIWDKEESIQYQNALHRVRFNGEVLPRFCLLYLRCLKGKGVLDARYGKGVTIKHLVKSALLSIPIPVPPLSEQQRIVSELDLLSSIIEKKKAQLKEYDHLAQSIFYDMFGDPDTNEKGWEVKKLGEVCVLKAGKAIKASELKDNADNLYPCYGGNGIRGYIDKISHETDLPIIGRQGALCGNVNYAIAPFYATEHAVVVSPIIELETKWLYYMLKYLRLEQYAHGVAQPGIAVNDLIPICLPLPPLSLQQSFASKIEAIERQKALIQQSITEAETLFNSRMDFWFS